jgi:hypothetical protein
MRLLSELSELSELGYDTYYYYCHTPLGVTVVVVRVLQETYCQEGFGSNPGVGKPMGTNGIGRVRQCRWIPGDIGVRRARQCAPDH